jgi:hypothetical protein
MRLDGFLFYHLHRARVQVLCLSRISISFSDGVTRGLPNQLSSSVIHRKKTRWGYQVIFKNRKDSFSLLVFGNLINWGWADLVSLKKKYLKLYPGCYFFSFLISNTLISYFPLGAIAKGWIFLCGLFIPLLVFPVCSEKFGFKKEEIFKKELLQSGAKPGFFIFLVLLALSLRFMRLNQYYLWPTGDESLHGFLGISLSEEWDWHFFYTVGEHPPLLIWLLAFSFKIFDSPFFALWFWPALFSSIAVPAGYFAAKQFLPKSTSALFGFLLGFSFWPLYFGRFCQQGLFIPFFELLSFGLLALWIRNSKKSGGAPWPFLLGIICGLGTLTFTAWLIVLFLLLVSICVLYFKKSISHLHLFLIPFSISLFPFIVGIFTEGYGHHLMDSAAISHWFSGAHQIITHFSYLSSLFWGSLQTDVSYGPSWGGILNPLLGSCFFIGVLELYQNRHEGKSKWIGLAFVICLLPAFLAGDYVELNRIIQIMPFLLVVSLFGLQRLCLSVPNGGKRKGILIGLLSISIILDLNHFLSLPLKDLWVQKETKGSLLNPDLKAYQFLNSFRCLKGPGLIFTEFLPVNYGHSLYVTTYHFNAASNPKIPREQAGWVAILTNVNYQPFLFQRFRESKWYWLENDEPSLEGGLTLGILPLDNSNRATFEEWANAQLVFHRIQLDAEKSFNSEKNYQQSLLHLMECYSAMKGDPFLETCYWEWVSQYFFSPSYSENVVALQRAVHRGYPAVHLYKKMSKLFDDQGKTSEANRVLRIAVKNKPHFVIEKDLEIKNPKD